MKRDWGAIQCVLETAEQLDLNEPSEHWITEKTKSFFYHAKLLCAEGYLLCDWSEKGNGLTIRRMTMKGHDLLDKLRGEAADPLV